MQTARVHLPYVRGSFGDLGGLGSTAARQSAASMRSLCPTQHPTHGDIHCGYARGIWLEIRRLRLRELFRTAMTSSFSQADDLTLRVQRFLSKSLTQQDVLTIPIDQTIDPAVSCLELY